MKNLIYFHPLAIEGARGLPGIERFSALSKVFKSRVMLVDRTGTIRSPIRTKSLFPIPEFRPFSKTYAALCDERAIELLARAEKLGAPLYILWSGGIDSTLVLVSLLKHASDAQKSGLVVLLSEASIEENPRFYQDHIRGRLRCESSATFPSLIGTLALLVSGEHNDQIFGAETSGAMMKRFGNDVIHKAYDRELFITFFSEKIQVREVAVFYVDLFERLRKIAPVNVASNHDVIWWFSFAVKWQSVYTRTIAYATAHNRKLLTNDYLSNFYAPFYNTDEFQLWSMNNLDKKIKDEWRTYKWPAKDIIYDYTKDADYRDNKTKKQSLRPLLTGQSRANFIDDSFMFFDTMDPLEYFVPENDFV